MRSSFLYWLFRDSLLSFVYVNVEYGYLYLISWCYHLGMKVIVFLTLSLFVWLMCHWHQAVTIEPSFLVWHKLLREFKAHLCSRGKTCCLHVFTLINQTRFFQLLFLFGFWFYTIAKKSLNKRLAELISSLLAW